MIETVVAVLVSAPAGAAAKHMLDAWLLRRTANDKRDEATSQADATLKIKRIDDGADIRHQLGERVEKLEKAIDIYLHENADLRVKIAERDATIALRDAAIAKLTDDIHEARAEADEARTQAAAAKRSAASAEDRCEALAQELAEVRRMSLR